MAEVNDLYLFEDDFGTILEILEDEEELDEQFREAAIEVSVSNFYSILKYHEKLRFNDVRKSIVRCWCWCCYELHVSFETNCKISLKLVSCRYVVIWFFLRTKPCNLSFPN